MKRALIAAVVVLGIGAGAAAPAFAEPRQVCVVYSNDRRAICVDIGHLEAPR